MSEIAKMMIVGGKKVRAMSIRIENDRFYILEAKNEKWLYGSEIDVINSLKKLSENKDLNANVCFPELAYAL